MERGKSPQRTGINMFSVSTYLLLKSLVYLPVTFQFVLKIMILYVYVYTYDVKKKGRNVLTGQNRIRVERQEYPKKTLIDAIEEKLGD